MIATAERLATAGLLEIDISAPEDPQEGYSDAREGGVEGQGVAAGGAQGVDDGGVWSDAHSVLLLCLVARTCARVPVCTQAIAVHIALN